MWFGENIKQSIDDLRLHHQLSPMVLNAEQKYPPVSDGISFQLTLNKLDLHFILNWQAIISDLKNKGHSITTGFYQTLAHGVSVGKDRFTYANADYRSGGDNAGF